MPRFARACTRWPLSDRILRTADPLVSQVKSGMSLQRTPTGVATLAQMQVHVLGTMNGLHFQGGEPVKVIKAVRDSSLQDLADYGCMWFILIALP